MPRSILRPILVATLVAGTLNIVLRDAFSLDGGYFRAGGLHFDDGELIPPHVEVTEGHPHRHHPGCGDRVVQHGDHTDFLHEGHRHAAHADHYDEH